MNRQSPTETDDVALTGGGQLKSDSLALMLRAEIWCNGLLEEESDGGEEARDVANSFNKSNSSLFYQLDF